MRTANKLEDLIGRTPIFKLRHTDNITLFLKLEMFNPGMSIKDRVARHIFHKAREQGDLKSKQVIVTYTSGNFGIGLAQITSRYGNPLVCITTSTTSEEKIKLLRNLGAQIVICDHTKLSNDQLGMVNVARTLATSLENAYFIDQFSDLRNLEAHYLTTGPEIWEQTEGRLEYLFAAMGTGGTASGTGKFLKEKDSKIKVIGVSPDSGVFHSRFYRLPDKRIVDTEIEGIGEDFIPKNLNFSCLDGIVEITDKETTACLKDVLEQTGLLLGGSSGTAIAAARKFEYPKNVPITVVVICPDSGNRYLSTLYHLRKTTHLHTKSRKLQGVLPQLIKTIRGKEQFPYIVS